MRLPIVLAVTLAGLFVPTIAMAHPHIWIQQFVRMVAKDGKYTHVEIEWRFDPFSSEIEIPLIDEDHDGKISASETKLLAGEMMPEFKKVGYLSWINTGAKDLRPTKPPEFSARIDDPASFVPPEWDRSAGDNAGMPMPANERVENPEAPRKTGPRNLVYVMRFALPEPTKLVSITTFDPDDFIRIEVDKASVPAGCKLAKHASYKAEFVRGHPVFAEFSDMPAAVKSALLRSPFLWMGVLLLLALIGALVFSDGVAELARFSADYQRQIQQSLSTSLRDIKSGSGSLALWTLVAVCFGYGVVHTLGPGHGEGSGRGLLPRQQTAACLDRGYLRRKLDRLHPYAGRPAAGRWAEGPSPSSACSAPCARCATSRSFPTR